MATKLPPPEEPTQVHDISRREVIRLGAAGLGGLLLAACGDGVTATTAAAPGTAAPATAAPAVGAADVMFDFQYAGTPGSMAKFWQSVEQRLASRSNGVTLRELTEVPVADLTTRLQAAAAAKSGAVLQTMWPNFPTYGFFSQGVLEPLDNWIEPDEMKSWLVTGAPFDGHYYNAPLVLDMNPLVVNVAHLRAAGVEYEGGRFESWESLVSAFGQLKDAGILPVMMGGSDGLNLEKWFMASEMEFLDTKTDLADWGLGDVDVTEPYASAWIDHLVELRDGGYINEDAANLTEVQALERFVQGEGAFAMAFPAAVFNQESSDFDVVGYWQGPGALSAPMGAEGSGIFITNYGENPAAGAEVIRFLHEPEQVQLYNELTGELPADSGLDTTSLSGMFQRAFGLLKSDPEPWFPNDFTHFDIIFSVMYPLAQKVIASDASSSELREEFRVEMEKWRDNNPISIEQLEGFRKTIAAT